VGYNPLLDQMNKNKLNGIKFSIVQWHLTLWVLSLELASCHLSGVQNREVTSNFFENLCTSGCINFHRSIIYVVSVSLSSFYIWTQTHQQESEGAMPWLRWLVTGLSLQKPGFNPRPFSVGFRVDKVGLGQSFLMVLLFRLSLSFCQSSILLIQSFIYYKCYTV